MFLEITKHLLDPRSKSVIAQSHAFVRQVGGQAPGLLLTTFPMDQQVDPEDVVASQITATQPEALSGFLDEAAEGLPTLCFVEPQASIRFLAQDIEPMPAFQLSEYADSTKFTVTDQENGCSSRDQAAYIGQQSQLLASTAVSADMRDPGPGDRDGSFAVGQTDDQQLMSGANLGAIDDQADLTQIPILSGQPLPGDRLIPVSHPNGRITQETPHAPNRAQQLGFSWDFSSDLAQGHRSALVDPHQQPNEVSHPGIMGRYSWPSSQCCNCAKPFYRVAIHPSFGAL